MVIGDQMECKYCGKKIDKRKKRQSCNAVKGFCSPDLASALPKDHPYLKKAE